MKPPAVRGGSCADSRVLADVRFTFAPRAVQSASSRRSSRKCPSVADICADDRLLDLPVLRGRKKQKKPRRTLRCQSLHGRAQLDCTCNRRGPAPVATPGQVWVWAEACKEACTSSSDCWGARRCELPLPNPVPSSRLECQEDLRMKRELALHWCPPPTDFCWQSVAADSEAGLRVFSCEWRAKRGCADLPPARMRAPSYGHVGQFRFLRVLLRTEPATKLLALSEA